MTENKTAKTPADGPEYERGFVEGMQRQMQLHVNRVIKEDPTAWQCQCGKAYTVKCISSKPSKRQWQGLTDDEVNELVSRFKRYSYVLLREVEAKLKEKNGG
jgi:hypothetical protein